MENDETITVAEEYRRLLRKTEEQKDELISFGNPALVNMVKQANEMLPKIHAPQERLMDAQLFEGLMHCTDIRARRLSLTKRLRTPLDVVLKIKERYSVRQHGLPLIDESSSDESVECNQSQTDLNQTEIDWGRLGRSVVDYFNTAPPMRCMLGFIDVERKPRQLPTPRQKRARLPSGTAAAPTQRISHEMGSSATDMDRNLLKMRKVLEERDCKNGIGVLELILDHDSYTQTVMNIFCLSFLVKDDQVALHSSTDGFLVVPTFHHHRSTSEIKKCKQFCTKMTKQQWDENCMKMTRDKCRMTNSST